MWLGCLALFVVFGASLFVGHSRIADLGLPMPWLLAAVLSLLLTLFVGSLQGLWQAWNQRNPAPQSAEAWTDGQNVRVTGVLRIVGEPVTAAVSGQPAAYYDYSVRAASWTPASPSADRPGWRGFGRSSVRLDTGVRSVVLEGMPSLREIPSAQHEGADVLDRTARALEATQWQVARDVLNVDVGVLAALLGGSETPGLRRDIINRAALDRLGLEPVQFRASDLHAPLRSHPWQFDERRIEPGARVTVEGTWKAHPPHLDIRQSVSTPSHAIHLGGAERLASTQWTTALAFVVVLGLLTAISHGLVHARQGALLRSLLHALSSTS